MKLVLDRSQTNFDKSGDNHCNDGFHLIIFKYVD